MNFLSSYPVIATLIIRTVHLHPQISLCCLWVMDRVILLGLFRFTRHFFVLDFLECRATILAVSYFHLNWISCIEVWFRKNLLLN